MKLEEAHMFEVATTNVESAEILQSPFQLHEFGQLQLVLVGSGLGAATLE